MRNTGRTILSWMWIWMCRCVAGMSTVVHLGVAVTSVCLAAGRQRHTGYRDRSRRMKNNVS